MFDWTTDFVKVPFTPLALKGFEGRLYVFGAKDIYRVDPNTLAVEEIYEGIGCNSDTEPLVTDYGMYWIDKNGVYWHDGKNIHNIGLSIKYAYDTTVVPTYLTVANGLLSASSSVFVQYSGEKKSVIFAYARSASATMSVWAWDIITQVWYYWEFPLGTAYANLLSIFPGKFMELYANYSTDSRTEPYKTYQFFNSANYLSLTYITRKYDAGLSQQYKKFYKIKSTTNCTVTFDIDDGTSLNKTLTSEALAAANRKAKNIQVKFVHAGGDATKPYIDASEIVFRQLAGMR